jgi:hypothetical protein
MRTVVSVLVTLVVVKYLLAHGWRVGFLSVLFLWWIIALIFPKHVHNPVHLARHHGRRFFRAGLHKKVGFPIAGFVVYLTIPIALPLVIFLWLWSLSYKHLKGKYRSIGQRLRRESYAAWIRSCRATAEEIRFISTFCTVYWRYVIGACQALADHHHRWSNEPVSGLGGEDGRNQDQPREEGNQGRN